MGTHEDRSAMPPSAHGVQGENLLYSVHFLSFSSVWDHISDGDAAHIWAEPLIISTLPQIYPTVCPLGDPKSIQMDNKGYRSQNYPGCGSESELESTEVAGCSEWVSWPEMSLWQCMGSEGKSHACVWEERVSGIRISRGKVMKGVAGTWRAAGRIRFTLKWSRIVPTVRRTRHNSWGKPKDLVFWDLSIKYSITNFQKYCWQAPFSLHATLF